MNERSDAEIVQAVLSGDTERYGELVLRHREALYGYALSLCGDPDTAADLTQDTLVAAYNALDRLRDPNLFVPWCRRILHNRFASLRRRNSVPTVSLEDLREKGFDVADEKAGPSEQSQRLSSILRLAATLPPKLREVLVLHYTNGFSYEELASFLGIPPTTVASRLYHARQTLIQKARKEGLL